MEIPVLGLVLWRSLPEPTGCPIHFQGARDTPMTAGGALDDVSNALSQLCNFKLLLNHCASDVRVQDAQQKARLRLGNIVLPTPRFKSPKNDSLVRRNLGVRRNCLYKCSMSDCLVLADYFQSFGRWTISRNRSLRPAQMITRGPSATGLTITDWFKFGWKDRFKAKVGAILAGTSVLNEMSPAMGLFAELIRTMARGSYIWT